VSTLVSAARATQAAGTFTFTISGTFAAAGQSFPIHGAGAVDARARRGRASLDLTKALAQSGIQTIPRAEARADAVASGGHLFVRSPYLARRRGTTKRWMQLASIPVRPLAYFGAVDVVKQLGTETVDGVETTHYSTEIDLRRAGLASLVPTVGDSLPADLWVDTRDRIRRVEVQVTTVAVQAVPQVDISGFGRPVAVRPPPPAQVSAAR
jgi:hypothetical protein